MSGSTRSNNIVSYVEVIQRFNTTLLFLDCTYERREEVVFVCSALKIVRNREGAHVRKMNQAKIDKGDNQFSVRNC